MRVFAFQFSLQPENSLKKKKKRPCLCLQISYHGTLLHKSCEWNQCRHKTSVTDPWTIHENLEQIADNAVPSYIWIMLCQYRVSGVSLVYALVLRVCPMALKMDVWCHEWVGDNGICREEMRWLRVWRCILWAVCLHGEIWQWRLCGPWMIFQHGESAHSWCQIHCFLVFFAVIRERSFAVSVIWNKWVYGSLRHIIPHLSIRLSICVCVWGDGTASRQARLSPRLT